MGYLIRNKDDASRLFIRGPYLALPNEHPYLALDQAACMASRKLCVMLMKVPCIEHRLAAAYRMKLAVTPHMKPT